MYLASKWPDMARKRVKYGLGAHSNSLTQTDLGHLDVRRIGHFFLLTTLKELENEAHCLRSFALWAEKIAPTKCTTFVRLRPNISGALHDKARTFSRVTPSLFIGGAANPYYHCVFYLARQPGTLSILSD
jgi:hypothetical protein